MRRDLPAQLIRASNAWIATIGGAWLPAPYAHAARWVLAAAMSLMILRRLAEGLGLERRTQ